MPATIAPPEVTEPAVPVTATGAPACAITAVMSVARSTPPNTRPAGKVRGWHAAHRMRIAIMGAGAMGSLFGAHLAEAGHDVLLVDVAGPVVAAIAADGVRVAGEEGERAVRVPVTADPAGEAPAELVLVLVKTYDTAAAAELAGPSWGRTRAWPRCRTASARPRCSPRRSARSGSSRA